MWVYVSVFVCVFVHASACVYMCVHTKLRLVLNLGPIIRFKAGSTTCRLSCGGSSKMIQREKSHLTRNLKAYVPVSPVQIGGLLANCRYKSLTSQDNVCPSQLTGGQ